MTLYPINVHTTEWLDFLVLSKIPATIMAVG